jgi:UDP-N-acetylmuramoylalanine--D-glutamate ligase
MNFQDKRVTVMGLGRFGGGLGVTKWLLTQGAKVLLTDSASESALALQLDKLGTHANLQIVFGSHRMEDFTDTDVVVANPAVPMPWANTYLQAAWGAGVCVTTEIELVAMQLDRQNVIGVTGTSGKSTTASMMHAALCSAGKRCRLAGNIGGSLLGEITTILEDEIVVLELSSAMLWWLDKNGGWSPSIAVLTTIEPNHIDWHGSFEAYKTCKKLLFAYQVEGDISLTQDQGATFGGLTVLGKHNECNAAVAFLAVIAAGADPDLARAGIQQFRGLPHRLEFVRQGYYNDSKSTTPSATKLAVDSFDDPSKVHLIVGGYDKQVDLRALAEQANRVANMYAIGATQNEIAELATCPVDCFASLASAVAAAKKNMVEGDVLLLSPGCASWDQFENYEQRGNLFCKLVREVSPTR